MIHIYKFDKQNFLYYIVDMFRVDLAKSIKFLVVFLIFSAFIFSVAFSWGSIESIYHFKTQTALCPPNEIQLGCPLILEHITSIQELFMAATLDTRTAFLILFILSLLAWLTRIGLHFRKRIQRRSAQIQKFFYSKNLELPLFNSLRLAFARGILNPKIY